LAAEAPLTPHAAERLARETAERRFEPAAKALRRDWDLEKLDGKQVQRWAEALGVSVQRQRDREVGAYQEGRRPECPANEWELLVIGMDGGRWQSRDKDEKGSRWREEKVLSVTTYVRGDGKERPPQPLVSTHVATVGDAGVFGPMARVEAERRGLRQATEVIGMGDGGNWLDPIFEREFRLSARIIDWCHASEHLWDCAKALYGPQTPQTSACAERWEGWLWHGEVGKVIEALEEHSRGLGEPQEADGPAHPRRVLHQNVGYFRKHEPHMNYPEYRARGWPIGSGVTEAAVKQFNKRIKGTEQFWNEPGVEAVICLRALWTSQDERWDRYWANRPAYVN
jgi:hypothetical protein